MRIAIATRSRSEELYKLASSFWPAEIPRHRVTGMNDWKDAVHYLHHIQNIDADLVINCDEDCFVFDWAPVTDLMQVMGLYLFGYAGMPDTQGNCHHRNNSPMVHNPFFNIFNPAQVQACLLSTPGYANKVLLNTNPPGCNHPEPFNNFFAALDPHVNHLEFSGRDHADGISTELCYSETPFALHSWYSREFEGTHRQRILNLYHEARRRSTLP